MPFVDEAWPALMPDEAQRTTGLLTKIAAVLQVPVETFRRSSFPIERVGTPGEDACEAARLIALISDAGTRKRCLDLLRSLGDQEALKDGGHGIVAEPAKPPTT